MKISIYLDVFPWMRKSEDVFVSLLPLTVKQQDCTRYRIDVTIPDPAEPDSIREEKAVKVE